MKDASLSRLTGGRGRGFLAEFPCRLELDEVVEHKPQVAEDAALHVALREHEGRERRVQRVLSWRRFRRRLRRRRGAGGVFWSAVGHGELLRLRRSPSANCSAVGGAS